MIKASQPRLSDEETSEENLDNAQGINHDESAKSAVQSADPAESAITADEALIDAPAANTESSTDTPEMVADECDDLTDEEKALLLKLKQRQSQKK